MRSTRPVLAGLLGLALLTSAAPAWAHDELVGTDPADGAVLATPPTALTMTFTAEVLDVGSTVVLTSAGSSATLPVSVAGSEVRATVPAGLGPGEHTVAWRVVSSDGHPIQGTFAFTVSGPDQEGQTPSTGTTAEPPLDPQAPAGVAGPTTEPSPSGEPSRSGPPDAAAPVLILAALGAALIITLVLRRRPGRRSTT